MRPVTVTNSTAGASNSVPIPLDLYQSPFNVSLFCDVSAGATLTYTVQYTGDDIFAKGYNPATGLWFDHADLTNQTADEVGTIISPVTAVRLSSTITSGSVSMRVAQSGAVG